MKKDIGKLIMEDKKTLEEEPRRFKKNISEEGVDYYLENGNIVFTEEYHKKRGYCCESNCRHCPYGFGKK